MNLDKETQNKIQELQTYEHSLHNLLMQKQAFQIELSETENALSEISSTNEDVFKVVGNIMIKTTKNIIEKDLKQKKDLLSLRLKSIEKQESELSKEMESIRDEVMKKLK